MLAVFKYQPPDQTKFWNLAQTRLAAAGLVKIQKLSKQGPPAAQVQAPTDQFVDVNSLGPMHS
jgi:hypothetical protein